MPAQVDIVNKALIHLAVRTISRMDEASQAAESATQIYDNVLDDVLCDHAWGFATTLTTLPAIAGETVSGWGYLYAYPSNCVAIRSHFQNDGTTEPDPIEFREVQSPVSGTRALASNYTPGYFEYTVRVTDPNQYSPMFIECLALRLAANLAHVLTGSTDMGQKFQQLYAVKLSDAKRVDANERRRSSTQKESSYVRARG